MSADETPPTSGRRTHALPLWLETILLLVVAVGLAVLIKTFFAQAFYVPSRSMEPGLVLRRVGHPGSLTGWRPRLSAERRVSSRPASP